MEDVQVKVKNNEILLEVCAGIKDKGFHHDMSWLDDGSEDVIEFVAENKFILMPRQWLSSFTHTITSRQDWLYLILTM